MLALVTLWLRAYYRRRLDTNRHREIQWKAGANRFVCLRCNLLIYRYTLTSKQVKSKRKAIKKTMRKTIWRAFGMQPTRRHTERRRHCATIFLLCFPSSSSFLFVDLACVCIYIANDKTFAIVCICVLIDCVNTKLKAFVAPFRNGNSVKRVHLCTAQLDAGRRR